MTVIAIQDDVQRKVLLLHAVGGNTFDIFLSLATIASILGDHTFQYYKSIVPSGKYNK